MKFPFSIAIWNGEEEEEKEEENPTQRSTTTIPIGIVFRGRGEDQKTVRVKVLTREDFMLKFMTTFPPTKQLTQKKRNFCFCTKKDLTCDFIPQLLIILNAQQEECTNNEQTKESTSEKSGEREDGF